MKTSLSAVVGRNVRELREAGGYAVEDIVREARRLGLDWSAGRVRHMEHGDRDLTVTNLLSLCAVLTELHGSTVPADLFQGADRIRLSESASLDAAFIRRLLMGEEYGITASDLEDPDAPLNPPILGGPHPRDVIRAITRRGKAVSNLDVGQSLYDWSQADVRASARLGLSASDFTALCLITWGQLLSRESEDRTPHGSTPQKKGRITRELLDELQQVMSRGND